MAPRLVSGTRLPLSCWLRTCRTNSMKAIATSPAARGPMSVGGLRTVWTYLYYLRTRSGK